MNSFKNYLQSRGHSRQSVESGYRGLCLFLNWAEDARTEPEQATHGDLIAYIGHLRKRGLKRITVQKYVGSLRHYFNWLIRRGLRKDNPARQIDIKGVQRKYLYDILSRQELDALYRGCDPEWDEKETCPEHRRRKNQNWYRASLLTTKRNRVITGLLIHQGLTTTELSRLKVKDVKLREGKINIEGTRRSNGRELDLKAVQMLDMMEYTLKTRAELLELSGKQSDRLLVSTGKGHRLHSALKKLMVRLNGVNSKVSSVRQIRASVITCWLKLHDLRRVQHMAGHRFVSSTEAFLINDLEDLSEDINRFHPIG